MPLHKSLYFMWMLLLGNYSFFFLMVFLPRLQQDEHTVPSSDVSSVVQHIIVAAPHLHYATVPQAAALLPPLDVRAAWQDVHHHQNLGGQCCLLT